MDVTTPLAFRPFDETSDADYEIWVAIRNACLPEYKDTVEEMKSSDKRRDKRCIRVRSIAEHDGKPVGVCGFGQIPWIFHPDRYDSDVLVYPDFRSRGFGGQLYDHVLSEVKKRDGEALLAYIREDRPGDVRFAEKRAFVEQMRDYESRLDVTAFDPAPWEEARHKPESHGIVIRSQAELADDPDRDRKLWELENVLGADVPSTEGFTPIPFESYTSLVLESPNLIPDAYMVGVETATGKYVGMSNLWKRQADTDLQTGLTGVRREYRRMGIALAMKLRVIDYAKRVESPRIRTENATTNRAMLSINEALGYVKEPAWIFFANELKPKVSAETAEAMAASAESAG